MKIEIRPIERKKWHGKTGKESFKRPIKIQALVDGESMEYATGLTKEERVKYEDVLKQDLSVAYNPDKSHPFWDSNLGMVTLKNSTMVFDTEIPLQAISISILKASKYVANSMKEWDEGLYPEATHVIYDEAASVEVKASKINLEKTAIIECSKLSSEKKVQVILIMAGKNLKGKSPDFLEVEIDKLVKSKPEEILRYIKMEKEDITIQAMIVEALQKNVLRKQGHKILYYDSVLGSDIYDVVDYFKKDENQDLKLKILSNINS